MISFKNSPIAVLTYLVWKNGRIQSKKFFMLFIYCTRALCSLPFYYLQSSLYANRIRQISIDKPPIFILGHYRSGTTYLHKLLATDTRFGYITNYDILCPNSSLLLGKQMGKLWQRIINLFRIKNYHFNNSIHQLDDPGEEDMYLVSKGSPFSAYWGFVFPLCWRKWLIAGFDNESDIAAWNKAYLDLLKQITYQNKGKQLVLKNPPNTGRVVQLLKIFPEAKFIYIHRNPFRLYYSMQNLWNRAITKYYSLQNLPKNEMEDIIFSHYKMLIKKYESDKKLIPTGNLIEIEYEQLEANPFEQIKKIYLMLNFPEFGFVQNALKKRIEMESAYKKFDYIYTSDVIDKIEKRWESVIKERHYKKPESIN